MVDITSYKNIQRAKGKKVSNNI